MGVVDPKSDDTEKRKLAGNMEKEEIVPEMKVNSVRNKSRWNISPEDYHLPIHYSLISHSVYVLWLQISWTLVFFYFKSLGRYIGPLSLVFMVLQIMTYVATILWLTKVFCHEIVDLDVRTIKTI